jgi:hypothetical protein
MLNSKESSFITDQIQLLTIVTELEADETLEMAFTVQNRAQNLREEWLGKCREV